MTLTRFVTKSAFRNKRRSILTVLSITFSLVLLTLMMTVWHQFYIDTGSAQSAQRLITPLAQREPPASALRPDVHCRYAQTGIRSASYRKIGLHESLPIEVEANRSIARTV